MGLDVVCGGSMKIGDLCRITKKNTHKPCHYGDYVILLEPLGYGIMAEYWIVYNILKGSEHHHEITEMEVIA